MRNALDIASWSALVLVIVAAFAPQADPVPPPDPPAPVPTRAFHWTVTDAAASAPQFSPMMATPPPALPPAFTPVANKTKGCGCGCPDCTGGPDCPCDCPKCKCRQPTEAMFAIDWLDSITELRAEIAREKKPGLMHVYMDGCPPCEAMERDVFPNQQVARLLSERFVCAKINQNTLTRETRRKWGLYSFPTDYVIAADWSVSRKLTLTTNPQKYLANLQDSLKWNTRKVRERSLLRRTSEVEQPVIRYAEPVVYYSEPVYFGGGCSSGACSSGNCGVSYSGGGYYGGGWSGGGGCAGGNCGGW